MAVAKPVEHVKAAADAPPVHQYATVPIGKYFKVTPTGLLVVPGTSPPFKACEDLADMLLTFEKSLQFAIGDAANYIEGAHGEKASQIFASDSGWALETVRNYRWVAEKVAAKDRMIEHGLSFAHHVAVARMSPADQRKWLRRSLGAGEQQRWPLSRLKAAIADGGDAPPSRWFVVVECKDETDQSELLRDLTLKGRQVKATTGHGKRKTVVEG